MKKNIGSFVVLFGLSILFVISPNVVTASSTPGAVVAWGWNNFGQTTVPADLSGVTTIAAGTFHTVALKNDGTVVAWGAAGSNDWGQATIPLGLGGVTAIAAGQYHTVVVKNNGTVMVWGMDWFGQTAVPEGLNGVTAVAANGFRTLALKSDGTVVEWGNNNFSQERVPVGLSGVVSVAAAPMYSLALKSDGTVVAWGWNGYGQTTVPAGLSGVVAVAAGNEHAVALKSDGTVVAWGRNEFGQTTVPVGLSGVVAIAAGYGYTTALKNDGTIVSWGRNDFGQTAIPTGLGRVTAIAAGTYHTVAIVTPDTVSPVLTVPDSISVDATSPVGAMVSYIATATDNITTNPMVICEPVSGSVFPIGTTTVTCTATDVALNSETKSFTVTVSDTVSPVLTVPDSISVDATSPVGAMVSYIATATDNITTNPMVICEPVSGSVFPIGTTTVTCTATDVALNSETKSFTVTVSDTVSPVLTVPDSISVDATSPVGAMVSYIATATDNITTNPMVICEPVSGSVFPIGTTTVTCTATDVALNSETKSFTVTVLTPVQMIASITQLVSQINASQGIVNSLDAKLQSAIASLDAIKVNSVTTAYNQLSAFINNVKAQSGNAITVAQADELIAAANQVLMTLEGF